MGCIIIRSYFADCYVPKSPDEYRIAESPVFKISLWLGNRLVCRAQVEDNTEEQKGQHTHYSAPNSCLPTMMASPVSPSCQICTRVAGW